jgi:3-isopropylmalate dehydrogenase
MTQEQQTYNIALMGGDSTGPEVAAEAAKVVSAAADKFGFKLDFHTLDFGGDRYLKTGEVLPDSAMDEFRSYDSILLGAIGHPDVKPGILEKGILLEMRFKLDQYINLRPVKLYQGVETPIKHKEPKDIDFVVVRENTRGIYTGMGGVVAKGNKPIRINATVFPYETTEEGRIVAAKVELTDMYGNHLEI